MPTPTLANVANPRGFGYGFAFNDRLFRLAVGPGRSLTIETAPLEAPRVNTTSSPEEATAEFGLTFARSQFDGGEGLFRAHAEEAAANRFWDSGNVSVVPAEPGEFPEVRLLHETENVEASSDDDLHVAVQGDSLYLAEGATIRRSDDGGLTFVDDDPHDGETATTVAGLASLGDEVYAALGAGGIHVRDNAGAWSHYSDVPATRIWAVKGRILASDGDSLYEVIEAGVAPEALKALAPSETWQDVVDGGSHVLAAASNGYVYAFATDTGTLVESASTLFEGETPRSLGQTQGIIAVGSSGGGTGRLYVGIVRENGQLGELQLVKQWGAGEAPRAMIGTRSAILMGTPDPDGNTYLWRYDVITGGVSRYLTIGGAQGLVHGLAVLGSKVYAAVDGAGLYREADTYADSGYLIGPLGDFYSASDKTWIGARLETGNLDGTRVELFYSTNPEDLNDPDSTGWLKVIERYDADNDDEVAMPNVVDRYVAGMVKLYPDAAQATTPTVRSFSFRAYPSAGDADVLVTLPVNVSDQLERRGRHRTRVRGLGERTWADLKSYEGRPVLLTLYEPEETIRGLVESVALPVQAVTRRGSSTVVAQVRVRGRRSTAGEVVAGTFGSFAWGELVYGGAA